MMILTLMMACKGMREKTAEELLENPKMKDEIFSAILNNDAHLNMLMNKMMLDENCKRKLTKNTSMMKMMFMSETMDSLMKADEELMKIMTNNMVQNMNEDKALCDKTCTKMMGSKYFAECLMNHNCEVKNGKLKLKK